MPTVRARAWAQKASCGRARPPTRDVALQQGGRPAVVGRAHAQVQCAEEAGKLLDGRQRRQPLPALPLHPAGLHPQQLHALREEALPAAHKGRGGVGRGPLCATRWARVRPQPPTRLVGSPEQPVERSAGGGGAVEQLVDL